jgi:hypothetical protein
MINASLRGCWYRPINFAFFMCNVVAQDAGAQLLGTEVDYSWSHSLRKHFFRNIRREWHANKFSYPRQTGVL